MPDGDGTNLRGGGSSRGGKGGGDLASAANAEFADTTREQVKRVINLYGGNSPQDGVLANKVLISEVFDSFPDKTRGTATLESFKTRLFNAHREGLITLSRADGGFDMPQSALGKSEINVLGATFHMIRVD